MRIRRLGASTQSRQSPNEFGECIDIEPFNAQRHKRELLMSMGATQTLAKRKGDWWLTVIGDVPVLTLRTFAAAMERRT